MRFDNEAPLSSRVQLWFVCCVVAGMISCNGSELDNPDDSTSDVDSGSGSGTESDDCNGVDELGQQRSLWEYQGQDVVGVTRLGSFHTSGDGNFYVAGRRSKAGVVGELAWVAKVGVDGTVIWQDWIYGTNPEGEQGSCTLTKGSAGSVFAACNVMENCPEGSLTWDCQVDGILRSYSPRDRKSVV